MASTKKQWRIDYNTDAPPCRLSQEGLLLHLGLVVDFLGAERRQGATILGLALQCIALGGQINGGFARCHGRDRGITVVVVAKILEHELLQRGLE